MAESRSNAPEGPKLRPCPICAKPAEPRFKPFCSARCADVDLNRWLSGSYAIPGRPAEDEAGEGDSELDPRRR
jgi:hypothetical protein